MERSANQRVVITSDMHGYGDRLPAGVIIGEAVRIEAKMSGGEFRNAGDKYYQTLDLKLTHRGFFRQYNYGVPLKELEV